MKYISYVLVLLLGSLLINCTTAQQAEPLTLVFEQEDGSQREIIHYPPGTTFELVNNKGAKVHTGTDKRDNYAFTGPATLIVQPTYQTATNQYPIQQGTLRVYTTHAAAVAVGIDHNSIYDAIPENKMISQPAPTKNYGRYDGDVTAAYTVSVSGIRPNRYNLKMSFSNGITFAYVNGETKATLDGNEVDITGKYVIKTPQGTAKVSFNPENGKVYYVFRTAEKE